MTDEQEGHDCLRGWLLLPVFGPSGVDLALRQCGDCRQARPFNRADLLAGLWVATNGEMFLFVSTDEAGAYEFARGHAEMATRGTARLAGTALTIDGVGDFAISFDEGLWLIATEGDLHLRRRTWQALPTEVSNPE